MTESLLNDVYLNVVEEKLERHVRGFGKSCTQQQLRRTYKGRGGVTVEFRMSQLVLQLYLRATFDASQVMATAFARPAVCL